MGARIDRRDFLQGAAITAAAFGLAPELAQAAALKRAAQDQPGYYPPALTGMRGSHPGSFEDAHALRHGPAFDTVPDTGAPYALIVFGGGIRGLSAAQDRTSLASGKSVSGRFVRGCCRTTKK